MFRTSSECRETDLDQVQDDHTEETYDEEANVSINCGDTSSFRRDGC